MPIPQDPFLFDFEQLHALSDEPTVREGLKYFKENRVTWVDRVAEDETGLLTATVEDAESKEGINFEIRYDADGNLGALCPCHGFNTGLCRHEVAALFAYSSRAVAPKELLGAVEGAIEERVQRARSEVRVEHLDGDPLFGAWSAWSVGPETHFPRRYQVHIRALNDRANFCTCPDFATNQLGTCKHIEAVLHQVRKRPDFARLAHRPAPHPFIFLEWGGGSGPEVRLHRPLDQTTEPELTRLLDDHFDAAGRFTRRLPEDFLRLAEALRGRGDIDLGQDALGYAQRLAEEAAHQARARSIRELIQAGGGRLPGVRARLYPYQMEGVAFLAANGRALLADDMGLGKTLQAIAAATWLREHAGVERVLIVCPASLKHQWAREIERFTETPVQVIQGNAEARGVQYRRGPAFYIANYELILRDVAVINETLRPDLLILDEAQRIKNWRTKIASAVKLVPSRYAFVLSGTPLENRLEDLYSLMQVVDPHVLGPLWRYLVDFHVTDDKGKVLGYRNLSELRRRLSAVMLRRDRRLVRDQLPDRIETRIDIELNEQQRALHTSALEAAGVIARIAKRRPLTPHERNRLMAALQSARMACDAAGLVDKETVGSPKLDELDTLLDELCVQAGLKAVIFSQWEQMTQMVEQRVRALKLGCVRLHGGVPTAKRGELMDRFRDDDAVQVFISTDAGATGLNLQSASVLVNMDVPWNPAVLDQRIARVHRLGQRETVQILNLVAVASYEEQVLAMLRGKRDLFDNVVDPDAAEDVVGVSKKLLEVLVNDLNGRQRSVEVAEVVEPGSAELHSATDSPVEAEHSIAGDAGAEPSPEPSTARRSQEVTAAPDAPAVDTAARQEQAVRRAIVAVQGEFGRRIERILGAGGGLLVVLDRVDDQADAIAARLSETDWADTAGATPDEAKSANAPSQVPVAVIDARTLRALGRLGSASPLAETQVRYEPPVVPDATPPLLRQARDKLKAAEVLIDQACPGPAMDMLLGAVLAAAALHAGDATPPEPRQAPAWLYSDALPRGVLSPDQAAFVGRCLAMAPGAEYLPEALLRGLLAEAAGFVG